MNALVAMLHFCEVHGPRVVFCTQATHHHHLDANNPHNTAPIPIPNANHSTTTIMDPPISSLSSQLSSLVRKETSSSAPPPPPPPVTTQSTCAACTAQMPIILSTKNGPALEAKRMIVHDDDNPTVAYIGTPSPQHLQLYKAARLACVRSLTTELCPGREGPVLFGDDENGYALSYLFKLHDAYARGETRFYSLMVLMTDRVFLISCWPFFVSEFKSMAVNLQSRANTVFQREKEIRQQPHYSAFRRAVTPMSQDPFFRRRSHTALRSLVDLLGIKDIYPQIHAQFSYILKRSARKRMEKITSGRSASTEYLVMRDQYYAKRRQQQRRHEKQTTTHHPVTITTTTTKSPALAAAPPSPLPQYS
ncbi:hypothetical protein O0I10_004363 [Lichtheimia ornata]|uniref:UDENN FLCN/SMCR8-type domain-containing protein n=1 Tax=Lichtheimia ornata TaxID=688661 RepID=A0AAD7V6L0_9FUNG|nr:uncharacterized protein O0I10_004363 [Lichtheimia ornata]KAJ8659770.1 hypothetical protein O0I10_004363 [Lichtheimia ornata]